MKAKSKISGHNNVLNEVIFLFNGLLADKYLFYVKIRNAKWSLDVQIFGLHQIFEDHIITTHDILNELTNQAYALGYFALNADEDYIKFTKSQNPGHHMLNHKQKLQALLINYGNIIYLLRKNVNTVADKYKELSMSNFIIELIEKHEKMVELLNTYLSQHSLDYYNYQR